jgi:hypothetical protein
MNLSELPALLELCPKITNIKGLCTKNNLNLLEILSKFNELKYFSFSSEHPNEVLPFIKMLKSFNSKNKLQKIEFSKFTESSNKSLLEFYKILFEKTNLSEFENYSTIKRNFKNVIFLD